MINLMGREQASSLRFEEHEQSVDQSTRIAWRVRLPSEAPLASTEREARTIPCTSHARGIAHFAFVFQPAQPAWTGIAVACWTAAGFLPVSPNVLI